MYVCIVSALLFIQALQLLHSFPLETRLKDGSEFLWLLEFQFIRLLNESTEQHVTLCALLDLFWQSPKRPPMPIDFDLKDPL